MDAIREHLSAEVGKARKGISECRAAIERSSNAIAREQAQIDRLERYAADLIAALDKLAGA